MRIDVNGAPVETAADTLAALIVEQSFEAPSVASAVDGKFVPREARAAYKLVTGMKVELLSPMQGG